MNTNMINQELSLDELDNINGGAKCPGCGKNKMFGTLWFHKLFCIDYRAKKASEAIGKMLR